MDTQDFGDVKAWLPMDDPRLENYKDVEILVHIIRQKSTADATPEHLIVMARWNLLHQQWRDVTMNEAHGMQCWAPFPQGYVRTRLSHEMQIAWDLGFRLSDVEIVLSEARVLQERDAKERAPNGAAP